MKNPSFPTWVAAIGAIIAAVSVGVAFAFTNFQTKEESRNDKGDILLQLNDLKQELHEMHRELDDLYSRKGK